MTAENQTYYCFSLMDDDMCAARPIYYKDPKKNLHNIKHTLLKSKYAYFPHNDMHELVKPKNLNPTDMTYR